MDLLDVLIVARTSPGKLRPLRTARTWSPSGDMPMDWTTPVPLSVWLVEMVLTTVWVLRLTTETPPPVPALATYRSPALPATASATGSWPTVTVAGVAEQPLVVVALHVAALKYSILLFEPSATYTKLLTVSTASAVGTEPDGSVTVAT